MTNSLCTDEDCIQFLMTTPHQTSCVEASRVFSSTDQVPVMVHDAYRRLLQRLEPDSQALWEEAMPQVNLDQGILGLDDSTLDKPHAQKMDLVSWHWSGNHHRVVKGINLLTLLWTDGD